MMGKSKRFKTALRTRQASLVDPGSLGGSALGDLLRVTDPCVTGRQGRDGTAGRGPWERGLGTFPGSPGVLTMPPHHPGDAWRLTAGKGLGLA